MHIRAPSSKVYFVALCFTCCPAPENQLQIHATKYEAPGPLYHFDFSFEKLARKLWELAFADLLRPMAIGLPII